MYFYKTPLPYKHHHGAEEGVPREGSGNVH